MNRLLVCLLASFICCNSNVIVGEDDLIDFDTEIIPILTQAGCNSGACHGAAAGRGEFYLSLYGSKPAADFNSIVHHLQGRRVNLSQPEDSLVITKPTEMIQHGGGTRLDLDSEQVDRLSKWIQQGAKRRRLHSAERIRVSPQQYVLQEGESRIKLRVVADFENQKTKDVSAQTFFKAEDSSAVEINSESGIATVLRPGRHLIIARYLQFVEPIILFAPTDTKEIVALNSNASNEIDREIEKLLEVMRIPLSPQADDFTFLRRIKLDLIGRLPTPDQVRDFANDQHPEKRQRLLEFLLNSEEFNDYWTYKFSKLLRIRSQPQDSTGAKIYHQWLRDRLAQRTSYADMVRVLLTAEGDSHTTGPANFYRATAGPREQAEFVSELFMGARLRCANCHDHPLDQWTQDDYHGLAAIFATVDSGRIVKVSASGKVIHPGTGETAIPRIPGRSDVESGVDGRREFSQWLISSENEYFAKAIVNRLWKHLMGRGFIEPVDDLRNTNPATHPELLKFLTDDFIAHGYDLRHTIRRICSSQAYSRSGLVLSENVNDETFYSHSIIKPLHAEVLADAIADATGVSLDFEKNSQTMRAVELYDSRIVSPELDLLGRCSREGSCEDQVSSNSGLSLMLHLLNGKLLNKRILSKSGILRRLINANTPNEDFIHELYLRTYSRFPTEAEYKFWHHELSTVKSEELKREVLQDLFWALLVSKEFQTNH